MTSPERLRRRQRIEGLVLILLAIFTAAQAVAFQLSDRDQQECVETKFSELSVALDARADLTARETAASAKVWRVWGEAAGLAENAPGHELTPEDEDRLQGQLVDALLGYQREVKAIQAEREANPLPPYPVGSCSEE